MKNDNRSYRSALPRCVNFTHDCVKRTHRRNRARRSSVFVQPQRGCAAASDVGRSHSGVGDDRPPAQRCGNGATLGYESNRSHSLCVFQGYSCARVLGTSRPQFSRKKRSAELESSVNPQARKPALLGADTLNGYAPSATAWPGAGRQAGTAGQWTWAQATLTSIDLGCAFSSLGRCTVRTPFLNSALTFDASADSGTVKLREKSP